MLMVKSMKLLRNSTCGLAPQQKRLLYRSCILPIALYGHQLWFYNKASLSYSIKELNKMQHYTVIWILGAFHMSPLFGIKAITGLIPIKFHFQKLCSRSRLRVHSLSTNHIIRSLLDSLPFYTTPSHPLSLAHLKPKQWQKIKGHIIDIKNRYNEIIRILDLFEDCFSLHIVEKNNKDNNLKAYCLSLDNITLTSLLDSSIALIVTDTSIKNQVAISIAHTHYWDCPIMKTIYHAINVTSTEAELFTIRCGINQAT